MTNRETLDRLFASNSIRIRRSALFDTDPVPRAAAASWDKVEGMLLGLAIGDSLGNTCEGWLPELRRKTHGEVRDYLPHPHAHDPAGAPLRGYPSDDTQMAYRALEEMIETGGLDPAAVARRFAAERIFGIGSNVKQFVANLKDRGLPWHEAGPESAGNGALMRIAPVIVPHWKSPSAELWVDTALCAMITHNDSMSIAACLAFVAILWDLLSMDRPPAREWWAERFVSVARELEMRDDYTPRGGRYASYRGPLWRYVAERLPDATRRSLSVHEAQAEWYSGAYLLETVPCVLYVLQQHAADPEEAIVRAVTDTLDNDTVGAIVGAAIGALHGRDGLPRRWLANMSGRLGADDDGRIAAVLGLARRRFGM